MDLVFERYTQQARRVLFFARFEAAPLGSASIEPGHLLLGLLRETRGLAARLLEQAQLTIDEVKGAIGDARPFTTACGRRDPVHRKQRSRS